MTTVPDNNIHCLKVDGMFNDCQVYVSSNLKWSLYHLVEDNTKTLPAWIDILETTYRLTVTSQQLKDTQADFWLTQADIAATLESIQRYHNQDSYTYSVPIII